MALVRELEIIHGLPHLLHLLDHRPRLRDGAAGIVRAAGEQDGRPDAVQEVEDRKSTRLNSSHQIISYAVFCLKKKTNNEQQERDVMNYNTPNAITITV